MYYRPFGRCGFPRCGIYNQTPRPPSLQEDHTGPAAAPMEIECTGPAVHRQKNAGLLLKCSAFGGLVLPEGTEKGAAYHVASLNLNTSGCTDFMVYLNFSCNIILLQTKAALRFRLSKQEKCQPCSVPVCAEGLYSCEIRGMEANTFTLSACDCDARESACCTYSVYVEIADFQAGGWGMVENPVLIATIIDRN